MSISTLLLGQKTLARVVPQLDELRRDPAAVLQRGQIHIGQARPWILVPVSPLAFALLGGMWGRETGFQIGLGLGLVVTVALVVRLTLSHAFLRLTAAGVEIGDGRKVVHAPWALFDAGGTVFNQMDAEARVPINPAALPRLELHGPDGAVLARGADVKTTAFKLNGDREVTLRAQYRATVIEVADLLLELGRRLGPGTLKLSLAARVAAAKGTAAAAVPAGAAPGPAATGGAAPALAPDGWFTAHLTQLVFPKSCCDCGVPTDGWVQFSGSVRFGWLLKLGGGDWSTSVSCWVCGACQAKLKRIGRKATLTGLAIGAALAPLALLIPGLDLAGRIGLPLFCLGFGTLIGWLVGTHLGHPVELARYSPFKGTVDVRFKRREYAEQTLAAIARARR